MTPPSQCNQGLVFSQDKLAQFLHEEQITSQTQDSKHIQDPCALCMEFYYAGEQNLEDVRQATLDFIEKQPIWMSKVTGQENSIIRLCSPCFADIMELDAEKEEY